MKTFLFVFMLVTLGGARAPAQTLVVEFDDASFRTNTWWRTLSGTWTSQVLTVKSAYWVIGGVSTNPVSSVSMTNTAAAPPPARFELTPVWHQPVMADIILSWEPVLGAIGYNVYAQSVKTSNAWVQTGRAIADLRHSFPFDLSVPVYTHVRAVGLSGVEGRPSPPMLHAAIVPLPAPSVRPAGILPHSQKRRSTATPEQALPPLPPLGGAGQTVLDETGAIIRRWLDARPTNSIDFRDIKNP